MTRREGTSRHLRRLELVNGRGRLTRTELSKTLGVKTHTLADTLEVWRLLPWVTVLYDAKDGYLITVDTELRDNYDAVRPRAALPGGVSIARFLSDLRTEITARRKANRDERAKSRWNAAAIITLFQTELLNWIETQLDHVDAVLPAKGSHERGGRKRA